MQLEKKEVEQIAALARLELTEEEKKQYAKELTAVLNFVSELREVNTEGVEETSQVTGLTNVVREDEAKTLSAAEQERLLQHFPTRLGRLLKVKGVFVNESEYEA
ncbi:MAG TPA: Asp-tRNA(Asn)/Glu-tRNA(Gln) amidotransferase subunit GatC [Patescibacteria group bacterium]|nr:Asp-tRNA(Asn)/Glu-tRNA(Gln) amidotransferase subunit GatC [Patescibacteria group bacterium]